MNVYIIRRAPHIDSVDYRVDSLTMNVTTCTTSATSLEEEVNKLYDYMVALETGIVDPLLEKVENISSKVKGNAMLIKSDMSNKTGEVNLTQKLGELESSVAVMRIRLEEVSDILDMTTKSSIMNLV